MATTPVADRRAPFGLLLRRHRLAAGFSQESLAERAGMSANGIGALERGDRRTPQRETIAILAQALGLQPEDRQVLESAAGRQRAAPSVRYPAVTRSAHNLPHGLPKLVGRAAELRDVPALIAEHRLVTLTGAGGIGKTSLAIATGAMILDRFDAGAWLIECAPLRDAALVVPTIAHVLDVQEAPQRGLLATLLTFLRSKNALLILDNCEHVIAEVAIVASALLHGCPNVRILATSREALRIAGEHTYRLPSLRVPPPEAAATLGATNAAGYGAIELFVARAKAADHDFELRDDNAAIVADLCRRLDGIPLAIELAAARVKMLGPRQLRDRLYERFRLLSGGRRDVLPRHQTLRALIDWSYDLLDERERRLMRRLSVFVNGFPLEGAVATAGSDDFARSDVFELLASLVDKSLVLGEADGNAVRFRMLETTREYALEKLEVSGEAPAALARQLCYLRDAFVAERERGERSGRMTGLARLFATELGNVRAALDGPAGGAAPEIAGELLVAIDEAWNRVDLSAEDCARLERFATLMPTDQPGPTSLLLGIFSRMARRINGFAAAEAARRAVDLARSADDPAILARALFAHSLTSSLSRRLADAASALTEAEALSPSSNVWLRLKITGSRAFLAYLMGDLATAGSAYERLCGAHGKLGNLAEAGEATVNFAENRYLFGHTEKALTLARGALPVLRAVGDRQTLLMALSNICGYLLALGRRAEIPAVLREAIRISAEQVREGVAVTTVIAHAALAIALEGGVRDGAVLTGYAHAAFHRLGYEREFNEQTSWMRLETILRERLTAAELDSLLSQGAQLSPPEAIAFILSRLDEPARSLENSHRRLAESNND